MNEFKNGLKDGIPIALGYFAVSFSFGILAIKGGLSVFQAVLTSVTNVTSAGQFAGLEGTSTFNKFTNGDYEYLLYVLHKN
jgi:predicted branched-subunit amino acid permease